MDLHLLLKKKKETLSKVYKNTSQQALTEASQNNRLVVPSNIVLPNQNLLIKQFNRLNAGGDVSLIKIKQKLPAIELFSCYLYFSLKGKTVCIINWVIVSCLNTKRGYVVKI